jgi:hypothetical protein
MISAKRSQGPCPPVKYPSISEFSFENVDPSFVRRAKGIQEASSWEGLIMAKGQAGNMQQLPPMY